MLDVNVAGINSQAVFKLAKSQDNPGDTFFAATCSHVVNELVTGHSAKATLYPLLGEGFEKRVKVPHYQVLQQMSPTCVWKMHLTMHTVGRVLNA